MRRWTHTGYALPSAFLLRIAAAFAARGLAPPAGLAGWLAGYRQWREHAPRGLAAALFAGLRFRLRALRQRRSQRVAAATSLAASAGRDDRSGGDRGSGCARIVTPDRTCRSEIVPTNDRASGADSRSESSRMSVGSTPFGSLRRVIEDALGLDASACPQQLDRHSTRISPSSSAPCSRSARLPGSLGSAPGSRAHQPLYRVRVPCPA